MSTYRWDPSLETGDSVVDSQHQGLMNLLNELVEADQTEGGPSVSEVLDRLVMYAATHFNAEEALMADSDFPDEVAELHRAEHRALSERARQFLLDYRSGEVPSMVPVAEFVREWLGHHIEQEDRRLVDHMREQSEKA